ncbi:MAG: acyl-CoA thioesterase [Bacteroidales bacterium]
MNYIYELTMKVRDYECDSQGIVNNAVYQNYLEHTRHEFLAANGVDFIDLHIKGIDPVVARIDIQYKTPLRGSDEFVCKLAVKKEGIKYVFLQDIFRLSDGAISVKAKVETVCLVDGRLSRGEFFDTIFSKYL